MPNPITPKIYAIILIASVGQEVGSFIIQIPQHLLIEAQNRAINFGIQYGSIAIGQAVVGGSRSIDPATPAKLFIQRVESLINAPSPEEAASRGTIAAAVIILASLSSEDPNVSLTFGGFLLILAQNVLLPGFQVIFPKGLVKVYLATNLLIRIVTEVRIERKIRKLKLTRAKFKFNIFKKQGEKNFVFKYLRFKKRKITIFSRNISFPVLC
jgi:hypothetical protein